MTKQEAMRELNIRIGEEVLSSRNTHYANINNAKDVWWFNIPLDRFSNDLYLILNKKNDLIPLRIEANTFADPSRIFKIAKDKRMVDLEISAKRGYTYMIDIKSGGTRYNFNRHILLELTKTAGASRKTLNGMGG